MADEHIVIIDDDDLNDGAAAESASSSKPEQVSNEPEPMECPICLQTCIHPARLPCGHIFCFLCVKGVANKNRRCAMCRRAIPMEFLDHPQLLYKLEDTTATTDDGYQWFYEGRNGWWQYDERTSQDIEESYRRPDRYCTILVAGYVYIVDFDEMVQQRQNDPTRKRQVKRDLATTVKKGVAGLRIDGPNAESSSTVGNVSTTITASRSPLPSLVTNNLISTIAATDAAISIANDIIDSTLAHASSGDDRATSSGVADGTTDTHIVTTAAYSTISNSSSGSSVSSRQDLLHEVEETLHISTGHGNGSDTATAGGTSRNAAARLDFFSQTIEEFRSMALTNMADTSSESDSDDDYNTDEAAAHTETELV